MGGSSPAPQYHGGSPISVPPFGTSQPGIPPFSSPPPESLKAGTLSGLPSLPDVFGRPVGDPTMFPNSQSFQQRPLILPYPAQAPTQPPTSVGPGGVSTLDPRDIGSNR